MTKNLKKRILVVDDEADVREYLQLALEDAGFIVETASDGLEAIKKIKENPPDLISLDLVMPKHSGVKCYRELQKDKAFSKIPVLTVTGHARDDLGKADFEEMTMSGPGVYLEKPVSRQKYVSAVRKLLGMEPLEANGEGKDDLQKSLMDALKGANAETLQKALDALHKKK
jgi:two-component system alkaline phosphatase synthesis response regulator PhoP